MNPLRRLILLVSVTPLSSLRAVAADDTPSPLVGRSPRVLFITSAESRESDIELRRLQNPGGPFDALTRKGWKIGATADNHIQIVDAATIPEHVTWWEIKSFPAVLCIEGNEIVRSFQQGCSTPLDAYTFGWLLTGVMDRPESESPTAVTVPTTSSYPLRGNHWNFEGHWSPGHDYMVLHLHGANHNTLFPQSWPIENWADEELRSLHDDLHEMGRPRLPLDTALEPGNSVKPGEVVPIYRPAYRPRYYAPAVPSKPHAVSAGATNAATRAASQRPSNYSRPSGGGFF